MVTGKNIAAISREIVDEFELFDDWMDKYEHLIEMGRSLPLIDTRYKTDEYLVRGCQSQVWLRAVADGDCIQFTADSDALITKGLVAVLLRVFNAQPASDVARADLSFLDRIGMNEHLSPTRKNGLDLMIRKIRLYAVAFSQSRVVS